MRKLQIYKRFIQQTQVRTFITTDFEDYRLNILDKADRRVAAAEVKDQARGRVYRKYQQLWPTTEAYEVNLTRSLFASVERSPLECLPSRGDILSPNLLSGSGTQKLLEAFASEHQSKRSVALDLMLDPDQTASSGSGSAVAQPEALEDKIIVASAEELSGTALESCMPSKDVFLRDMHNCNEGGESLWDALPWVDPLLSARAAIVFGPVATRTQTRLLHCLLNPDHNDVLFNAPDGTGKSSALLLAALNAVRSETAGLNILVCRSSAAVSRAMDTITAICGEIGGEMADRATNDFESWLLGCGDVKAAETCAEMIRVSPQNSKGGLRLCIVTSSVLAEMLFEHQIPFAPLGYLRRVFFDDIGRQLCLLPRDASTELVKNRLAFPRPVELILATLHQMPLPFIRANLQLGLVGSDLELRHRDFLEYLCIKRNNTVVMTPMRIPSSVHCMFSFFTQLGKYQSPEGENFPHLDYACDVARSAREIIPGRVLIFVEPHTDLLAARMHLRKSGMDVRLASEVLSDGRTVVNSKFVLLTEQQAAGVDFPAVSHVFITFTPQTPSNYMHMCSFASRIGNVGWTVVLCNQMYAPEVRAVVRALDVDFVNHVVDSALRAVPKEVAERWSAPPGPGPNSPASAVEEWYDQTVTNAASGVPGTRELVQRLDMMRCDYEPMREKIQRFNNSRLFERDFQKDPAIVLDLREKGLLDEQFRPTDELLKMLTKQQSLGEEGDSLYFINKRRTL